MSSLQISKSELDLPQNEPDYAKSFGSGYPPTIWLTITHMPLFAHDPRVQMETDLKLKVSGLKEAVEFCLPLPIILPTTALSTRQSSKFNPSFVTMVENFG